MINSGGGGVHAWSSSDVIDTLMEMARAESAAAMLQRGDECGIQTKRSGGYFAIFQRNER